MTESALTKAPLASHTIRLIDCRAPSAQTERGTIAGTSRKGNLGVAGNQVQVLYDSCVLACFVCVLSHFLQQGATADTVGLGRKSAEATLWELPQRMTVYICRKCILNLPP